MRKPSLRLFLFAIGLVVGLRADVDLKNFDLSIKPQDDFYRFVNGTYLKNTPIPPEYSSWGSHAELTLRNQNSLRALCERAAAKGAAGIAVERQVGDFYASGMDEAAINAAGAAPLQEWLDCI